MVTRAAPRVKNPDWENAFLRDAVADDRSSGLESFSEGSLPYGLRAIRPALAWRMKKAISPEKTEGRRQSALDIYFELVFINRISLSAWLARRENALDGDPSACGSRSGDGAKCRGILNKLGDAVSRTTPVPRSRGAAALRGNRRQDARRRSQGLGAARQRSRE
jgi:hypothetical protein